MPVLELSSYNLCIYYCTVLVSDAGPSTTSTRQPNRRRIFSSSSSSAPSLLLPSSFFSFSTSYYISSSFDFYLSLLYHRTTLHSKLSLHLLFFLVSRSLLSPTGSEPAWPLPPTSNLQHSNIPTSPQIHGWRLTGDRDLTLFPPRLASTYGQTKGHLTPPGPS